MGEERLEGWVSPPGWGSTLPSPFRGALYVGGGGEGSSLPPPTNSRAAAHPPPPRKARPPSPHSVSPVVPTASCREISGLNTLPPGASLRPGPRCTAPPDSPRRAESGGGSESIHTLPGSAAAVRHFCFPRRRSWCIVGKNKAPRLTPPPPLGPPAPHGRSPDRGRGVGEEAERQRKETFHRQPLPLVNKEELF